MPRSGRLYPEQTPVIFLRLVVKRVRRENQRFYRGRVCSMSSAAQGELHWQGEGDLRTGHFGRWRG